MCYSEEHLIPDYPWKDMTNLKFCTKCGIREHFLEEWPIMLEALNNKKNVIILYSVSKKFALNTKNLQIITRKGKKMVGITPNSLEFKEIKMTTLIP